MEPIEPIEPAQGADERGARRRASAASRPGARVVRVGADGRHDAGLPHGCPGPATAARPRDERLAARRRRRLLLPRRSGRLAPRRCAHRPPRSAALPADRQRPGDRVTARIGSARLQLRDPAPPARRRCGGTRHRRARNEGDGRQGRTTQPPWRGLRHPGRRRPVGVAPRRADRPDDRAAVRMAMGLRRGLRAADPQLRHRAAGRRDGARCAACRRDAWPTSTTAR